MTPTEGKKTPMVLLLVVLVAIVAAACWGYFSYTNLIRSMEQYSACQNAGNEMQEASDYLTDQARHFASVGDPEYMDNYFTEANVLRRRDKALEEIGRYFEGTEAFEDLQNSLATSTELMETEYYSMRLVCEATGLAESRWPDEVAAVSLTAEDQAKTAAEKRSKALSILLDSSYFQAKDVISSNASKCTDRLLEQTQELSASYEGLFNATYLLMFVALVGVTILSAVLLRAKRRLESYQEELEEAVALAQASEAAKTRFLFNMSHDIRTPLNAVLGFANLLERHRGDDEAFAHDVASIKASGGYLLDIITNVLDTVRLEDGKLVPEERIANPEELNERVEAVYRADFDKKGIDYRFVCDGPLDEVITDPALLSKAALNIVGNAVKYTPECGSVVLELRQEPAKPGWCDLHIVVRDTGVGMSEEFLAHAFESFERERTSTESGVGGTGLGLGIVKGIVECLGGEVRIESEQGVGTTVSVAIPQLLAGEPIEEVGSSDGGGTADAGADGAGAVDGAGAAGVEVAGAVDDAGAASSAESAAGAASDGVACADPAAGAAAAYDAGDAAGAGEPDLSGKRILLAEDNDLNAEIVIDLLEETGVTVERACDGAQCVEMMEAAQPGCYDLVLMDIQMPNLNGYDATRRIRAMDDPRKAGIPIYAISANAFEEDKRNSAAAGMDGHLSKPVDEERLLRTVASILGD